MSDAARQTVRDMGRMYEELYGGCGAAPMTRAQFIDFVHRVISVALQRAIAARLLASQKLISCMMARSFAESLRTSSY
jgi:hypothetical protein